jgi:hypothetical protein
MEDKINELETSNKNKNIRDLYRGINELKKGYQARINVIKEENGNLLADPQSVHEVHDDRQMDIHVAEPLVPESSLVEVEIAVGKLESYKSPDTDQGVKRYILRYTNLFVLYGIRNCHSSGRNPVLYQVIKRVIRLIVIIIKESHFY